LSTISVRLQLSYPKQIDEKLPKTPLSKTTAEEEVERFAQPYSKINSPNYFQCEHPRRLIQTKVLVLITNWITLLILLIDECLAELLNQQVLSTTHIIWAIFRVNSEKFLCPIFHSKIVKIIFRVNSVIFRLFERIPECILNINFMNFAGNSNLQLNLKIKKIIFMVNLGIF